MAEVVEEMPKGATPSTKYDWDRWLDGQVWKLVQSVTLEAVVDEATGQVVVPEQVIDGDFSVDVEKMRSYARNAARRRKESKAVRSRVDSEVVEVVRVPGEAPVQVKRRVLFVQGVEKSPTGGKAGRPRSDEALEQAVAQDVAAVNEDTTLDSVVMSAVNAGLAAAGVDMGEPVRQSDIEQPDEPEWVEIAVEEDPEDPYAPSTGDYPAADVAVASDEVAEQQVLG